MVVAFDLRHVELHGLVLDRALVGCLRIWFIGLSLQRVQRLIPSTVLEQTTFRWLPLLPRYLAGIVGRLENLAGHVPRDVGLLKQLQPLHQRLDALQKNELTNAQALEELRFMLEELRLKTFTEPLSRQRTQGSGPDPRQWRVSSKRVVERLLIAEREVGLA